MSGRFVESSPSKELLDEAFTEGDADPEEATRAGRAASRHRCQAAPKSVAFTAIILCTALLAIAFMRRPLPTEMVSVASVTRGISLTTGIGDATTATGTGCNNWKVASLDRWAGSADECVQACRNTRGCIAANYQAAHCPTRPYESTDVGTCYLMNEECQQGPNECWAVYTLPEESRMPGMFDEVTHGAGCKNMATIGKGQLKMFSRFECQAKCSEDDNCDGFLHNQCTANGGSSGHLTFDQDGAHDPHTCELFHGECVEDKSSMYACWSVYHKDSKQGTVMEDLYHFTEDAGAGATTATVEHPECFRVGDSIQLFHEQKEINHRYVLTSTDPMTFSPALSTEYVTGTAVLRIHHPYSPKYCGDFPSDESA